MPAVVVTPMPIVPVAALVGAPRLLLALPPVTLFREMTLSVPPETTVLPVYVFAPLKTSIPLAFAFVRFAAPLMIPEIVKVVLRMSRVVVVPAAPGNVHGPLKVIGAAARPTIISVPVPLKVCQEFAIVIGPVAKAVVVESVAGVASTMLDTETVIGPVP